MQFQGLTTKIDLTGYFLEGSYLLFQSEFHKNLVTNCFTEEVSQDLFPEKGGNVSNEEFCKNSKGRFFSENSIWLKKICQIIILDLNFWSYIRFYQRP